MQQDYIPHMQRFPYHHQRIFIFSNIQLTHFLSLISTIPESTKSQIHSYHHISHSNSFSDNTFWLIFLVYLFNCYNIFNSWFIRFHEATCFQSHTFFSITTKRRIMTNNRHHSKVKLLTFKQLSYRSRKLCCITLTDTLIVRKLRWSSPMKFPCQQNHILALISF